ncbi:MAG: hypothetical protein M0006_16905 [Magnetospirillum sp.]|nr:hypothetical protein [Magnetospirillum sp.]
MSLLAATDSSFAQSSRSHNSALWQSAGEKGHSDTVARMIQMTAGGGLTVKAGKGILADYRSTADLKASLAADPVQAVQPVSHLLGPTQQFTAVTGRARRSACR